MRSRDARRRRNRKSRQRSRQKFMENRTLVWIPPEAIPDIDLEAYVKEQLEFMEEIPDGDDPPRQE